MKKSKIFYAVQATGKGHISRAQQLYPYLKKFGEVDFFISGNNANLDFKLPVKYKSKGCSLHYSKCGGLKYFDVVLQKSVADMDAIKFEKPTGILNSFLASIF